MSTKTIRKRIALATVAALGAGVLSLVSTTAANAADNAAPGAANTAAANGVMNIATVAATTGVASTSNNYENNQSVGLLAVSDLSGGRTAGLTQTATLLNTGTLVVYTSTSAGATSYSRAAFTVTGGTIVPGAINTGNAPAGPASTTANLFASGNTTYVTADDHGVAGVSSIAVVPASGASQMTIKYYSAASTVATSDLLAAPASYGTLRGVITVTLASSSTSGTVSVTNSAIYYTRTATSAGAANDGTSEPNLGRANQPGLGINAYNVTGYGVARIRDAYAAAISAGALIQASASNGALVIINQGASSGSCTAGTPSKSTSSVFSLADVTQYCFAVASSVSTASSTVVTITVDGTTIGTKSFTFYGKVAKVILGTAGNGKAGTSAATSGDNPGNSIPLSFQDSAGNVLKIGYYGMGSASYTSTGVTSNSLTTGVSLSNTYLPGGRDWAGGTNETSSGYVTFKCALSTNVSGQLVIDYTNLDGSVVTSNAATAGCTGAAASFTAAFDKSTYKPGDIATMTVTFKDSTGALAADNYTKNAYGNVATSAVSTTQPTITASNMTPVGGVSATNVTKIGDVPTNGVIKYTFIVGSTTGSYGAIVSFPDVQSSSVTVPYAIADGSTSLNDVLKGIVDLIASINKQIAALAKLVTKSSVTKKK